MHIGGLTSQELNPIPYIGILGQTSGQVIYGSIIKNWFVFMANAPGLIIGLWLTLSTIVPCHTKSESLPHHAKAGKRNMQVLCGTLRDGLYHIQQYICQDQRCANHVISAEA